MARFEPVLLRNRGVENVTALRVYESRGGYQAVRKARKMWSAGGVAAGGAGGEVWGGVRRHGALESVRDRGGPVVGVSGLAIRGGGSVRVRHPGESARDARSRRKAERKAKKLLEKRRRGET